MFYRSTDVCTLNTPHHYCWDGWGVLVGSSQLQKKMWKELWLIIETLERGKMLRSRVRYLQRTQIPR